MFTKASILIPAAFLVATLSACSSSLRYVNTKAYLNTDLIEASYEATDQLKEELCHKIPKGSLIVVSTLLNVKKNPNETSSFGRIISNQIATDLHNSGYQIIALDLPIDLFMMEENGELQLSDKDKALFRQYQAAVLVGGVYAPGKQNAYVSLRAVNRFTKHVIASTDFSVPVGPDVKALLSNKDPAASTTPSSPGSLPSPVAEESSPAPAEQETAPIVDGELPKLEEMPGTPPKQP